MQRFGHNGEESKINYLNDEQDEDRFILKEKASRITESITNTTYKMKKSD